MFARPASTSCFCSSVRLLSRTSGVSEREVFESSCVLFSRCLQDNVDFASMKVIWGDERSVRQSRRHLTQLIEVRQGASKDEWHWGLLRCSALQCTEGAWLYAKSK